MVSLPIPVLSGASLLVHVGDTVAPGQILAQKEGSKEHTINLAILLKVSPEKTAGMLLKQPGDAVAIGDTLAIKRNIMGMTAAKVSSNINGIVTQFDSLSGSVSIADQQPKDAYVLICPIAGLVQVCDNNQIVIQTDQNLLQGFTGAGETVQAKLYILPCIRHSDEKSLQTILLELNNSIVQKVIVGRTFNREALIKAIGVGCVGIVATAFEDADIVYLHEKNMLIPIIAVNEKQLQKLIQHQGEVFLEGTTGTILLLA